MTDLIDNEQAKLVANALDRASTTCFTVGIATPIAGIVYNIGNFAALPPLRIAMPIIGWILLALLLHYLARRRLRRLQS